MLLAPLIALALASAPDGHVARLARAAHLWGEVRYFHPYLYSRDVDWDDALLKALPAISAAETPEAERAALQSMLDPLHDPATRVLSEPRHTPPSPHEKSSWEWVGDGILAVRLEQLKDWEAAKKEVATLKPEVEKARGVIFDLRGQPGVIAGVEDVDDEIEMLAAAVPALNGPPLAYRVLRHSGYRPQFGETSGDYQTQWVTTLNAEAPKSAKAELRVAFLIDSTLPLPELAVSLQAQGRGWIVSQGEINERQLSRVRNVDLGDHLLVLVRNGELATGPAAADLALPPSEYAPRDAAYRKALAWLKAKKPAEAPARGAQASTAGAWKPDKPYKEWVSPTREQRFLSLFRFWNIIRFFYPYLKLLDQPWDDTLAEMIPVFEKADGEDAYARAVAAMAARIEDQHINVWGTTAIRAVHGAPPPVSVQLVDDQLVFLEKPTEAAAPAVDRGDVVVSVDGEPISKRAERLEPYVPAATRFNRKWLAMWRALSPFRAADGQPLPEKQEVTWTVRGADGSTRDVRVDLAAWTKEAETKQGPPVSTPGSPSWRMLDGNIGYVDLNKLERTDIDKMFEQLAATKALIFDMRGYPRGVFHLIGPRLNVLNGSAAALFHRPVIGPDAWNVGSLEFEQPLGNSSKPKYTGKVVMLIDERAASQAEHTCLFVEAAAPVTFVGSPTAGTNGDVTFATLPGGLKFSFTGHDVRHADGRQLQRVGIQPTIPVRPTIAGIRAGKDEVLERAVQFVRDGR